MRFEFFKKRITSSIAFCLLFLFVFNVDIHAANVYNVNGVNVSYTDFSSSPNECWVYANNLYRKIWGYNFTNQFSHETNCLRNLSDSELTLTPEHLKAYVSFAELGSVLRVCDAPNLHGNDQKGHSQIIVQKDENGFTVLQGGLSSYPYKNEQYYTWEGYCNSRWPGKYHYIKYIKWPYAEPYEVDKTGPVISDVTIETDCQGYTVCCSVTDKGGVDKVLFPTWLATDVKDDLDENWILSDTNIGCYENGKYSYRIDRSDHGDEFGEYITNIYAYDKHGNVSEAYPVSVIFDEHNLMHIWNSFYTMDVAPTSESEGVKSRHCSLCDMIKESSVKPVGKLEPGDNPFQDVDLMEYYINPVIWAYNNNITTGVNDSHFGPNETCTRGQAVTFLWRILGCPDSSIEEVVFEDVDVDSYYYKAVLWAVENHITNGTDELHFSPNDIVTRAQFVTFLWRCNGAPVLDKSNSFNDVSETAYFYDSVNWAIENNVTNGINELEFAPDENCTRGQVVTFLYRMYR